ncbi:hypothetical protein LSCM1_02155 [Leishmania martiniquensis]|uniref:Amastin-like protein n=1 Tax=Leishmania martiniquensis TaxID=1580590 RepID=A0A836G7Z1_9TRYP|nr:hypothetical protein LSCM1_02155 [Leishmania martiniquensis]
MGCISGLLFGILQFVALVLIAVGTPLAMFLPRSEHFSRITNNYCISMWGIRDHCLILVYSGRPEDLWTECSGRLGRFKAAQVCAIAAAIILVASMLASVLDACCCCCAKYLCLLLNLAAVVVLSISWGSLLDCYLQNQGSHLIDNVDVCVRLSDFPGLGNRHPEGMQLGAGFIFLVLATIISFLNIFIIMIPC